MQACAEVDRSAEIETIKEGTILSNHTSISESSVGDFSDSNDLEVIPATSFDSRLPATLNSDNGPTNPIVTEVQNNDKEIEQNPSPVSVDSNNKRKRRKVAEPKQWKRNVQKILRAEGKPFIDAKEERALKPPCNCKKQCILKVPQETRIAIHAEFWDKNKTWDAKRQFVASSVTEIPKKQCRSKNGNQIGRRKLSKVYSFTVYGKRVKVCKIFFLNTKL